ncbi:MAG: terminase large subunit [Proteobacteria bacterium]|nr:terminase large subunit [Pseudomonadota bacterium]
MGQALARDVAVDRAYWDLSNPGWFDALKARRSLLPPGLPLNDNAADRGVRVFNELRLPDVPGRPRMADSGNDWVRDVVRALFGSWDPLNGVRYIEEIFALVPKKNSKTTGAAGIMLTVLIINERPSAQFALFGPTQEIATLSFSAIKGMIEADEELPDLLHVQDHLKIITNRLTGATLKVMTFDAKVATGGKYAGALIDEVHLLGTISWAADVLRQIRGGRISIAEGFLILISTQSDSPPAGVFKTELDYGRAVRDGRITNSVLLPIFYELPEEVQRDPAQPWKSPELWALVTPNLGFSITIPRLQTLFAKADADGAAELRGWASQHLNIEIGLALHSNRWIGADYWEGAADRAITFADLLRRSECIVFGADGGGLDDLFGFAALGREKGSGRWLHWGRAYADRGVLERHKQAAPRLLDFEKDNDLVFIDIAEAQDSDVAEMVEMIVAARDAGLLPANDDGEIVNAIGIDRSGVAIGLLIDALLREGFPATAMRAVGQGYRLQTAHGIAARKLKQGTLRHAGQPLMAWSVGNAKAEMQGHSVVITKQTSGVAKIDPLIALFNAVDLMSYNPQAAGTPGIFV